MWVIEVEFDGDEGCEEAKVSGRAMSGQYPSVFISGRIVLWASGGPVEPLMPACPDCISQAPNDPFDSRRRPFSLSSCLLSSSMVDAKPKQRPITYAPSSIPDLQFLATHRPSRWSESCVSDYLILPSSNRLDGTKERAGLSCRIFAACERGLFIQIWKHSIPLFSGLAWR